MKPYCVHPRNPEPLLRNPEQADPDVALYLGLTGARLGAKVLPTEEEIPEHYGVT